MTLLFSRLRQVLIFIYILAAMLVLTLFFNMYNQWEGISLIVRIYIFVFSFYLILSFSSAGLDTHEKSYQQRFGKWAEEVLFFEVRVLPFLLIYVIIFFFALADGVRGPQWPWNVYMDLLGGKYINLVVYSLFLLFVLKLKKDPFFSIPLFLLLCVLYFYLDLLVDSVVSGGPAVQLMLLLKFIIFFFFLFVEFFVRRRLYKLFGTAVVVSLLVYVSYIGAFRVVFAASEAHSYQKRVSGLQLLKMGFTSPFGQLTDELKKTSDPELLKSLLGYARRYGLSMGLADGEWEKLMFSGGIETADAVAEYILNKNVKISYGALFSYIENVSTDPAVRLQNWGSLIQMAARVVKGNERDFTARLQDDNKAFAQWCIAVAGELNSSRYIPALLGYLTSLDANLSETAYRSLSRITGLDPRERLNRRLNDPEVMLAFKEFYLGRRTGD